jgi:hypothetical protein
MTTPVKLEESPLGLLATREESGYGKAIQHRVGSRTYWNHYDEGNVSRHFCLFLLTGKCSRSGSRYTQGK